MKIDLVRIASKALFGTPYPFELKKFRPHIDLADFKTSEGNEYSVVFIRNDAVDKTEIQFGWRNPEEKTLETGITGTGDSLRVFSTVLHAFRAYLNQHSDDPTTNHIEFSALKYEHERGSARPKLYDRMISQFLPSMFPDLRKRNVEDDGVSITFELERVKPIKKYAPHDAETKKYEPITD